MQKMAEAEIQGIAETIAPQTSGRFTTVVFQDGTMEAVEGSGLGYGNVWVIIQGKAEPRELYAQLLQSYNEIQYCQGW
ncbi:MAG TPA: hypothetical protein VN462_01860 [Negativicutes bacterium]|nr:hypothetical protein [Negativicutes bacterium]